MIIDLHNHSYYSDGILSPSELVRLANEQACDVFALTDHDTVDGLAEAKTEADKLGVKFIPGVEISAMWSNMTIHILGLGVDSENKVLQVGLKQHQDFRQLRAEKMARGLGGAGVFGAMKKPRQLLKKA